MAFDVFISYPHEDKAAADAVCATLETAGMRCWIAPRDVRPSADWAASIVDAIDNCRVMILVFSSRANQSRQVHREVQRAFDQEKPVVPFRIEDAAPIKTLAYYMGPVHWLDALTPPLEQHLQALAQTVKGLLHTGTAATAEQQQPRQQPQSPPAAGSGPQSTAAHGIEANAAEPYAPQRPRRTWLRSRSAVAAAIAAIMLLGAAVWYLAISGGSVATVRFDGIYRGPEGDQTYDFRFYSDGTVIAVASADAPATLANWFKKENPSAVAAGKYLITGSSIRFSVGVPGGGSIDYQGTIERNELSLTWVSHITNRNGAVLAGFVSW